MAFVGRRIEPRIQQLVNYSPVVLLTGARQVGKTTLVEKLFPEFKIFTMDPVQGGNPHLLNLEFPSYVDFLYSEIIMDMKTWRKHEAIRDS